MKLLEIVVRCREEIVVKSNRQIAKMILFDGYCKGDLFSGDILPGGVDTQITDGKGNIHLSARYALQGVDDTGLPATLFIENEAWSVVGDKSEIITKPTIITDSSSLKWLETDELYGRIMMVNGRLLIRIYNNKKELAK